jgi:hypothetical protein
VTFIVGPLRQSFGRRRRYASLVHPYGNDGSSIIDCGIPEVTAGGVERMVEVGDRIVVESEKVGESARTGMVTGVVGSLIKIKWDDGSETSMVPAAGSLRVVGREAESKS